MKRSFIITAILCYSFNLFAQNNWELNLQDEDNLSYEATPINIDEVTTLTNIWVRDSFDFFVYHQELGGEPILSYRSRVTSRTNEGQELSAKSQLWQEDDQTFINKDTLLFSYHSNGERHLYIKFPWNSSTNDWEPDTLRLHAYNEMGETTDFFSRRWNYNDNTYNTNAYANTRDQYEFDEAGRRAKTTISVYDFDSNVWLVTEQELFTYAPDGLSYEKLLQKWDSEANIWVDDTKSIYTTDIEGKTIEKLQQSLNSQEEWSNSYRSIYEYNANGEIVQRLDQVPFLLDDWEDIRRTTYEYDGNNNLTERKYQKWDAILEVWIDIDRRSYTYDENENSFEGIYSRWNNDTQSWENIWKFRDYWSQFEIVKTDDVLLKNISISPNPTTNHVNIVGQGIDGNTNFIVFSTAGQPLKKGTLNNGSVDFSHFPTGLYLLKITTSKGTVTKRIIKE